ncbi:hypothetical protein, partial [uncultured Parabacteroides sp.]|uniref:hypothetical protein n=1 Tax=uncultured Parabacteroides sp. TaxID=512312 RepID=UPI0026006BB9
FSDRPSAGERPRRGKTKREEAALFERSEFADDRVVFPRSSEAGAALNFWLLFFQEKSNIQNCQELNLFLFQLPYSC